MIKDNEVDKRKDFPMHRCVFENDLKGLQQLLKTCSVSQKDLHGNSPLHLAIMLGHKECIALLLAHNAPVKIRNVQGWTPLAESISYGDRHLIGSVLRKLKQQSRDNIRCRKPHLLEALKQLGDFYLELKWDFHCWIPLVSKVLPSDVCKIYKKGSCLRMDTTLVDFNERSWERGDISFIFDSNVDAEETLVILDNKAKVFQRVKYEESEAEIEDEVDILMSSDIVNAQMSTKAINFTRAQIGWIFKQDRTETIGPYSADFYMVEGLTMNAKKRREHLSADDVAKNKALIDSLQKGTVGEEFDLVPPGRRGSLKPPPRTAVSWKDYISCEPGRAPVLGREPIVKHNNRNFKCTIAMSMDFPLTIQQLLDIFEIVAPFKHIRKLRDFCQLKLPPGFPIKVEIPLLPTVSAKVTFQKFKFIHGIAESLFKIPKNYREDSVRILDLDAEHSAVSSSLCFHCCLVDCTCPCNADYSTTAVERLSPSLDIAKASALVLSSTAASNLKLVPCCSSSITASFSLQMKNFHFPASVSYLTSSASVCQESEIEEWTTDSSSQSLTAATEQSMETEDPVLIATEVFTDTKCGLGLDILLPLNGFGTHSTADECIVHLE